MTTWTAGLYEWSPAVVGHLDRFWRGERGVQEVTQRRRHVAHAELDPKQRDLDYVRCSDVVHSPANSGNDVRSSRQLLPPDT